MSSTRPLTLAVVAGEQSGQSLAVGLVDRIAAETGAMPHLVGVGGNALKERGLETVFDPSEIAITGIAPVVKALPRLLLRIRQTAHAIANARPDAVIFVDSPDFSHRVARRIREKLAGVPIVKYVAPTVWAWRPERARRMKATFDRVLAVFPFEPDIMAALGGPETHYVGHPLAIDEGLAKAWAGRHEDAAAKTGDGLDLLVLPGSRRGEVSALLRDFERTLDILQQRGRTFRVHIPTLPYLTDILTRETQYWPVQPRITTSVEDKLGAFRVADAALAASGTVILELALAGVPAVSCYRTDVLIRPFRSMIKTWSAALPNIIADRPIVPEFYDEMIRPGMLARHLETLADANSPARAAQMAGFADVRKLMEVEMSPGDLAARVVLDAINGPAGEKAGRT
ncbi:lipid-A-disaccharide synthase [Oricola sp.]|uniref:lipid-A-disaccharide synthase n=1 Tax=Oricola sp. TaxID=1979950 RepID=UPI003BA8DD87